MERKRLPVEDGEQDTKSGGVFYEINANFSLEWFNSRLVKPAPQFGIKVGRAT